MKVVPNDCKPETLSWPKSCGSKSFVLIHSLRFHDLVGYYMRMNALQINGGLQFALTYSCGFIRCNCFH